VVFGFSFSAISESLLLSHLPGLLSDPPEQSQTQLFIHSNPSIPPDRELPLLLHLFIRCMVDALHSQMLWVRQALVIGS
jgi:hypothetical protein